MENENNEEKKAHIYEIDFLRAITVFSVVTIHSFASTSFLYKSTFATDLIALFIHILHYNREIFVFVTGLVLTYVYYHRKFSTLKFWSKRLLFIFVPYVAWSIVYVKINNPTLHLDQLFSLFWNDLWTGNASYQLYYILLTLQYYLIFPFFLWFIKKIDKHPLIVLSTSFALQIIMIYFDFTYLQRGPLTHLPIVKNFITPYQDRLFIIYQFYFVFGAIVAIYMDKSYKLIQKYGKFLPWIVIISLLCFSFYFFHQLRIKDPLSYALGVLQPSVVIFSTVIIVFFAWLSTLWVKKKQFFRLIKGISDVSFGIFFVHVLILTYIIQKILPILPPTIPILERIILVDLATFISSVIICLLLIRTKFLSWTIGRAAVKRSRN